MTMNRLPSPSAETAAMWPSVPAGTSWPVANRAQAEGMNVTVSGSFWPLSTRGSIPVGAISVRVNCGPKLALTSEIAAMSAAGPRPEPQPISTPANTSTPSTPRTIIAVNLPTPARSVAQRGHRGGQ